MSFLSETVLTGSTRLYIDGAGDTTSKDGWRTLRKSQSHGGGFFTPLIQLVRDPIGTLGGAVGNLSNVSETADAVDLVVDHNQVLYLRMRNAESYGEWKTAATELDTLEGNDAWKLKFESQEYDAALVAARLKQFDDARINCDVKKMLFLIRTALTRGLGGMGDLRLYKHSHVGTKALIERYIKSVQETLQALFEVSVKQGEHCPVKPRELMDALLATRQSFGRSALLLSGGGTFGMNHIGVIGSLWKASLLPRIISGASAGSIVCAVVCTKTDAEIPDVLEEFCYGDLAVFEKEGEEDGIMKKAVRFLKYGALFDITHLINVMRNLLGDITFQESYNRTRRILNITVSSASLYELPRLLNYVTAPNVMIWSAVCASCSVPFVFSPASLLAKDPKTGKEVPWNPTPNAGWIDGSVDNDLPMTRLAEMFNVNHFIVSQVNPHVVPFLAKEEENISTEAQQGSASSAGPSWIHQMANLAKGEALHRLHVLSELGIFPNYVTKARSVLNQRYSGDITIFPSIAYAHFPKVLSNPTTEYMLQCSLTGERATWPKLSRVQNHVAIELALDETIRQFRTRVVFSHSQVDLRLSNLSRPLSQGNATLPGHRPRPFNATTPSTPSISSALPTRSPRSKQLRVKSRTISGQVVRPYLPLHFLQKHSKDELDNSLDTFSSSTNFDGSSSDEEFFGDSDTSDILSSPSPPYSPSSHVPTLWPSTRQLFPSASQPATPSISASLYDRRNSSFFNLNMTPTPSSPEIRYKCLYHPPETTVYPNHPPVDPVVQHEVEKITTPLNEMNFSFPDAQMRALDTTPYPSPAPSPLTTSAKTGAKKLSKQKREEIREDEQDRRGSRRGSAHGFGLGLLLDISGTRGMMLRRNKNSKSGVPGFQT